MAVIVLRPPAVVVVGGDDVDLVILLVPVDLGAALVDAALEAILRGGDGGVGKREGGKRGGAPYTRVEGPSGAREEARRAAAERYRQGRLCQRKESGPGGRWRWGGEGRAVCAPRCVCGALRAHLLARVRVGVQSRWVDGRRRRRAVLHVPVVKEVLLVFAHAWVNGLGREATVAAAVAAAVRVARPHQARDQPEEEQEGEGDRQD